MNLRVIVFAVLLLAAGYWLGEKYPGLWGKVGL